MRSFTRLILGLFASPLGVLVLGFLDSTLFFSLPFGIDAIVVILAARFGPLWWIVAIDATLGAVAGAALTFWMGVKIGENGLERWVPPKRLHRVRQRVRTTGAIALAAFDLIPPPFPFTPFVLAAGALEVDTFRFFATLTACRIFRFGVEAGLAHIYGTRILAWLDSDTFHDIVAVSIIAGVSLTAVSIVKVIQSTRPRPKPRLEHPSSERNVPLRNQ